MSFMRSLHFPLALAGVISFGWFGAGFAQDSGRFPDDPREGHLANIRQVTFFGENAEAFSADGTRLIFQSRAQGEGCD